MVRRFNEKAAEREEAMQMALAGVKNGTYATAYQAAKALGVSTSSLDRRLKGGLSRREAKEKQQLLTTKEEEALANWISTSTSTGNPVQHSFIREMAQKLRTYRVNQEGQFLPPIGDSWVPQFLSRHRHLQTKMSHAIETARVKEVTKEQVLHFNEELRRIIQEHNIKLENAYNTDETGYIYLYFTNCRVFNRNNTKVKCCY
jgi:Tc5 transposase DNA-binding domain